MAQQQACTHCGKSFPPNHFLGKRNRACQCCAACRGVQPVSLLAVAIPAPSFQPQATTPASLPPPPSPVLAAPAQAPSAPVPLTVEHVPQRDVTTDIDALHARLDAQANFSSQLAGSVSEIRQLILSLCQDQAQLAGSASFSRPVPSAPTVTPAQPPQASTPSSSSPASELQLCRLFPWISPEVAQLVYDDRLCHDSVMTPCIIILDLTLTRHFTAKES
ncbi:uncharacterized protein UDID_17855 [Ustilago sp. UG-2017a]|nr:uncharacterized protein UDID_17855 [Ustilago sp. UG-2017a]